MPGYVERYVKERRDEVTERHNPRFEQTRVLTRPDSIQLHQDGYSYMREELDRRFDKAISRSEYSPEETRGIVRDVAIRASQGVANDLGDRGAGWEHIMPAAYDKGRRDAIRDWSHEHNHALLEQIRERVTPQRDRAEEFGMSL